MKNVLIVSASPRRGGNCDLLCDQFAKGAREAGHTVEIVYLQNQKINYCLGCGGCYPNHACVQQDGMPPLLDKLVIADVIVLATPVYFYSMSGQLKTFIDRTVPRYTELVNKDFYFILTAADKDRENLKRTVESLRGFTEDCLEDAHEKGIIYGVGAWQKGEIVETPAFKEAYLAGKNC